MQSLLPLHNRIIKRKLFIAFDQLSFFFFAENRGLLFLKWLQMNSINEAIDRRISESRLAGRMAF